MKNRPCRGLNMAIRAEGTPRKRRGYTNAETARKVLRTLRRGSRQKGEGDHDGLTVCSDNLTTGLAVSRSGC